MACSQLPFVFCNKEKNTKNDEKIVAADLKIYILLCRKPIGSGIHHYRKAPRLPLYFIETTKIHKNIKIWALVDLKSYIFCFQNTSGSALFLSQVALGPFPMCFLCILELHEKLLHLDFKPSIFHSRTLSGLSFIASVLPKVPFVFSLYNEIH